MRLREVSQIICWARVVHTRHELEQSHASCFLEDMGEVRRVHFVRRA